MRLWHKDLIPYLPRQQLIAQWWECCAIAASIAKKGTPNHLLVNKVLKYPACNFLSYSGLILEEMNQRGCEVNNNSLDNFIKNYEKSKNLFSNVDDNGFYSDWHNDCYLKQCLFNLKEKYDCGGIPEEEWKRIGEHFDEYLD